jgi:hypothetical protein
MGWGKTCSVEKKLCPVGILKTHDFLMEYKKGADHFR